MLGGQCGSYQLAARLVAPFKSVGLTALTVLIYQQPGVATLQFRSSARLAICLPSAAQTRSPVGKQKTAHPMLKRPAINFS